MSFNMTFKKLKKWARAGWFLCVLLAFPTWSSLAAQESVMPDDAGEILLVYDENPGEEAISNAEKIVNLASAMGKVIDYGSVPECTDGMDNYPYIICLDLHKTTEDFERQFLESSAERMVLGGSFMKEYLEQAGQGWRIRYEETQKKGRLVYGFTEGEEYEELIEAGECMDIWGARYQNGSIYIAGRKYPFCSQVGDVRFIPLTDFDGTLSEACLMWELQNWLWPYEDNPPDFAQYIVIDEVYPFMPAEDLLAIVQTLAKRQVPYIISVMPVSRNGDYPSMKQFCQVLAYAQKNKGMVVLHAPIIHKKVTDVEELYEELTLMTLPFVENGVYPMGIQVPYSWTNQEIYLEVLKRYRTVYVYDDGESSCFSMEAHTNTFCRQGHQAVYPLMELDDSGVSQLRCYSSAIYLDRSIGQEELLQIIEDNRVSANPFMDMWNLDHSVWLNDFWINYQDHILYLNGERTEITYEPAEYDEDYDFGRTALQKISLSLQSQNQALLVIVAITIVIFSSFIVYARVRNRKRFLYGKPKKRE